jgi:hypothetical protein
MHDLPGAGAAAVREAGIAELLKGCSAREREFVALRIKHGADGSTRTFNVRSMAGDFVNVAAKGGLDELLGKLDTCATLSRPGARAQLFVAGSEDALTPDTFRALAPGADLFLLHSNETELEYWCRRLSPYWGEPDGDY